MTASSAASTRSPIGRMVFAYALVALGLWRTVTAYADVIARGGADHQTADWLISYAGGFERRGLFGTLALTVLPPGQSGLWVLFWVQMALVAVPLAYAFTCLRRASWDCFAMSLLLGPAAFAFVCWDPGAIARKETMGYIALMALATAVRSRRPGTWATLAAVLYVVACLSWEGNCFLIPAALYLALRLDHGRVPWAASFTIIAVGTMVASLAAPGTPTQRTAVCGAIRAHGYPAPALCTGAVAYIGQTTAQAQAYVAEKMPTTLGYLPWVVVALAPLLASTWWRAHRAWGLVIVLAIAPLAAVGIDDGRWISLAVCAAVICLTAVEDAPTARLSWGPVASALYLTLWGLPHAPYFAPCPWPSLGAVSEVGRRISELLTSR